MKKSSIGDTVQEEGNEPVQATTVECPVHHRLLQIQTENREIGGKTVFVRFAVCNCDVPDNQYLGKMVWEQT